MRKKIIFEKQTKRIEDNHDLWEISICTKSSTTLSTIYNDYIDRLIDVYSPDRYDITIYDENLS